MSPSTRNQVKPTYRNRKSITKKSYDCLAGSNFRIYRVKLPNGNYESFDPTRHSGLTKVLDSIVHRFDRVIGFSMGDEDELIGDLNLTDVRNRMKQIRSFPKSEANRVACQGNFENFVLATATNRNPYKRFLRSLQNPEKKSRMKITYVRPSDLLIQSYLLYMSDSAYSIGGFKGRGNAYNSVRTRLAGISGTCKEFGLGPLKHRSDTLKLLKELQGKVQYYICRVNIFFIFYLSCNGFT